MSEEIKILAVGYDRMTLIDDKDHENLLNVRKFLESLPEYHEFSEMGEKLHEMADRIDNVYWLHEAYKKRYEFRKNYSLTMQEILKGCDGFVIFKEYIGMAIRISNKTKTSLENNEDLYTQIAHDKKFPVNKDASWKSYRQIINHVMQNYDIYDWDKIRDLYREYQAVIEGRWFP